MESGPEKPSNKYMCVPKRTGESEDGQLTTVQLLAKASDLHALLPSVGRGKNMSQQLMNSHLSLQASLEKPFPPIQAH